MKTEETTCMACLCTLTPDNRPVIGFREAVCRDCEGFRWQARIERHELVAFVELGWDFGGDGLK